MDKIMLLVVSVLLCAGAAYRWIKYVDATVEAQSIVIKGERLKAVTSKSITRNG